MTNGYVSHSDQRSGGNNLPPHIFGTHILTEYEFHMLIFAKKSVSSLCSSLNGEERSEKQRTLGTETVIRCLQ
jgi:hypothetical protein